MKASYQISLIILICLALFVIRDDVATVFTKVTSSVSSSKTSQDIKSLASQVKDTIVVNSDKVSTIANTVSTPGALKVTQGLVSNANEVKLSIKDVIAWTNMDRRDNGNLPPLTENSKLDFSAQIKVNDMLKQQYFEHVSPDGVGVSDLGAQVGYEYIVIGENLALGNFKDAQSLLNAWMNSPGHRANILNKRYTDIGVAVGHGMYKGEDLWLAVQHFGLPRSACPAIDELLHGSITLEQTSITTMESDLSARKGRIDSGVVYNGKTPNEQIADYNTLVAQYNSLIQDIKQKISDYNVSVRAFNTCLATNS